MATQHTIYVGVNLLNKPPTVHFVDDKDCLPADITSYSEFTSTADPNSKKDMSERFFKVYDFARFSENHLGFHVSVDVGNHTYETGEPLEYA